MYLQMIHQNAIVHASVKRTADVKAVKNVPVLNVTAVNAIVLKKKLKNAVVKIANVINQNAKKLQKINVIVKNVNVQKSVNVLKIVNATNVNVQII